MKKLYRNTKRGVAFVLAGLLMFMSVFVHLKIQSRADEPSPSSITVCAYDTSECLVEYCTGFAPQGEGENAQWNPVWEPVGNSGVTVSGFGIRISPVGEHSITSVVTNPASFEDIDPETQQNITLNVGDDLAGGNPIFFNYANCPSCSITAITVGGAPQPCQLSVESYDNTYGKIYYTADLNGDNNWVEVGSSGTTSAVSAFRVKGVPVSGNYTVSYTLNNSTNITDDGDNGLSPEVGTNTVTNIVFAERSPGDPGNGGGNTVTPILVDSYTDTHGKMQYSVDDQDWIDIPAEGITTNTDAMLIRAVPAPGYSVSYKIDSNVVNDPNPHGFGSNPTPHNITDIIFSLNPKSLNVSSYTDTYGKIQYSTDGNTWTDVPASGASVSATHVRALAINGGMVDSYKLNNTTIPSDASQILTQSNNTISDISFVAAGGTGGKYTIDITTEDGVSATTTISFINASGNVISSVSSGTDQDIPEGTAKIRIGITGEKQFMRTTRVFRKETSQSSPDNSGTEIARRDIEDSLWNTGSAEFSASTGYSYEIRIVFDKKKSVRWRYPEDRDHGDTQEDEIVEHARLYRLNATSDSDINVNSYSDSKDHELTVGQTYYFLLVPDYGYQVSSLQINNGPMLEPIDGDANMGVFKFEMTNSNFHFKGIVSPTNDFVSVPNNSPYSGATIRNGNNAVDSGNVRATITATTTDNTAATVVGDEATAVATVDIDLDKVVSKGDGTYWSSGITAFTNDVTLSIPVPADELSEGQTYTIVRNHNGVKTALNSTYNSTTGMLTFDSNRFSDYTVVKTAGEPETTPDSEVTLTVRFEGTQYDHFDVHMSPDEVVEGAAPVLCRRIGESGNTYEEYTEGQSFTVTAGESLPIYVKLSNGYTLDMGGCGTKVGQDWVLFLSDDQYEIAEGHENPGSASYSNISTTDQCTFSNMDLVIKIYRIADPNEDPNNNPDEQPGKASSFSVSFKDNSNEHVQVVYRTMGSDTDVFVPSSGASNVADVEWFRVIPDPGYVVTGNETIVITQTAGTKIGENNVNDNLVRFDPPVSQWGFGFVGNDVSDTQNVYTCSISNIEVRQATASELLGKYRMVLVTKDGVSLSSSLDAGARDANDDEIDTTYTRIDAGSTSGSTGYVDLPDNATQLFVTMNPADGNNFETATLVGYDADGAVVSRVSYDYDEVKNTQMGKRPIDPSLSYVLTVTFSRQKKIYWTSTDSAKCTLYLLKAQGNEDPDPNSRRNGTEFLAQINQTYYFLMIPNYGYQVNSLNINGNIITPISGNENMGIFKFVMGNGDFRIQPSLKTSIDKISNTSNQVETVSIANGAAAGVGGNLSMSVSDIATDETAVNAVRVQGDGEVTAVATVNIDLKQVVEQGNGSDWNKELRNLNGAITVGLAVDASGLAPGETYSVVRKHGTLKEELNATYNSTTGMLTFPSAAFSEYTIVKKPGTPATTPASSETKKEDTGSDSDSSSDSNDDDNDDSSSGSTANVVASTLGSIVDKTATGGLASKTVIKDWNDLNNVLIKDNTGSAASKNNKKKVLTDRQKAKGELVQIVLNKKDATIPDSTFDSLYKSDKSGLHVFVANGTALTFINNRQLKNQKALDLTCIVTSANGSKIISFKTYAKLKAKTMLHTTVPAGVKTVTVYKYDAKGNRKYFGKLKPTAEGRVCFGVKELTKYELVYTY